MHKLHWDFEIQTDHPISAKRPDLVIINKKKRTCQIVDFSFPADHRVKLKESEKKDKYLQLGREVGTYASMLPQKSWTFPSVCGKKRLANQIEDKIIQSICLQSYKQG